MMRNQFTLLLVCLGFLVINPAISQQYDVFKGREQFRMKKSFAEIVEHNKLYPRAVTKGTQIKNEIGAYPELPVDPSDIISIAPKLDQQAFMMKDPSPAPDKDFLGLDDSGGSIPPDVNGAAGPDHLMVTLNTDFRIMDKEGNEISTVGAGAFWHPAPGSGGVFDPKISYDPYEDRWILIEPSSSDPTTTKLMVAVSETSDPTGNWFLYSFDGDPEDTHWFDYPNYGFNDRWIVATGNLFGPGGTYVAAYVLNKHDLYNNAPEIQFTRFKLYDGFTVVPAVTYDPDEPDIYMVNNAGGNNNGSGYLKLWRVSGPTEIPVVEDLGLIEIPEPWSNGAYSNAGNFLPQLGSEEKINSVDARLENLVYRHGKLWTTHHVFLPAGNPSRTAVQWFELNTAGEVQQWGRIDDPDGNMFFAFATIAVNAKEDIMVGFGSFSEDQYASGSYAFRYANDQPNTMRDYYQYKDGLAPYFKTFGADRNRWGDYTATWVDPSDDLDFWTIQEYAEVPQGQDEWGVWWAYVNLDAIPEAQFSANITTVPVQSEADFTDHSKFTPTSWKWIFEGGEPNVSTEQNPQDVFYAAAGVYDVTLIAGNELGFDTLVMENYIEVSTTILPEVEFSLSQTIPCMGESILLEDLSVYNPISWEWSFTPDYVTFVNGSDANSQNPEVLFDYGFTYSVTLTATNTNGSSTLTKNDAVMAGGMPLPFIEDFESRSFTLNGWTIDNPDGEKTWEMTTIDGNGSGEVAAFVNIKSYNGLAERDRLISPPLNFYGFKEVTLDFEYAYAQRFAQYTDSLIVFVSGDCGESWIRMLQLGEDGSGTFATTEPTTNNFIPFTSDEWCGSESGPACITLDLSAWSGMNNIRVMFETYNGYGNNIILDNVQLQGEVNAVNEVENALDISVYPNPSAGLINIDLPNNGKNSLIQVISVSGQVILERQAHNDLEEIDLRSFEKGIYLVKVMGEQGTAVKKILLK
jgi:PKD repeat protein